MGTLSETKHKYGLMRHGTQPTSFENMRRARVGRPAVALAHTAADPVWVLLTHTHTQKRMDKIYMQIKYVEV